VLHYDWEKSIGHWVWLTSHALRKAASAALLEEGITLRQWEILAWLSCNGGASSQAELADALGIAPHTLGGVVDRMVRDGLLLRRSCDLDRRKNLVAPTTHAKSKWAQMAQITHQVRSQATREISEGELEQFRQTCERIRENLSGDPGVDRFQGC